MGKSLLRDLGISPLEIAVIGGGGFLMYKAVTAVGEKFGLIKSDADRKAESLVGDKRFSAGYLQELQAAGKRFRIFSTPKSAPDIATKIYEGRGYFKDDMSKIMGALKRIKYDTQIAQVADAFNKKYGSDMLGYLNSHLSENNMAQVVNYINSLPSGIV